MRLDAIFKYHFTFEYWVLTADTAGNTTYQYKEDRKGMYVPGGSMTMSIVCDEPMDTPMQIRNLRDRSGNLMFQTNGESYPMYVVSAEPQLDPFSNVVAWKHSLRKNLPREYTELIDFALSDSG